MADDQAPDGLVIENRALIHLSNIMIANARAHKFREMAELAKSKRANERLGSAISTFIGLVGSKTLSTDHRKTIDTAHNALAAVKISTDKAPEKTEVLAKIINDIEGVILANKWHDMPRHGGSDMTLVEEFYGLGPEQEGAIEAKEAEK